MRPLGSQPPFFPRCGESPTTKRTARELNRSSANKDETDRTVATERRSHLPQAYLILLAVTSCSPEAANPLYQLLKQEASANGLGSYPLQSALDGSCDADCTIRQLQRDGFGLRAYVGPGETTVRCGSLTLPLETMIPLVRNGLWPIDQYNYTIEFEVNQECAVRAAIGHSTASSFL